MVVWRKTVVDLLYRRRLDRRVDHSSSEMTIIAAREAEAAVVEAVDRQQQLNVKSRIIGPNYDLIHLRGVKRNEIGHSLRNVPHPLILIAGDNHSFHSPQIVLAFVLFVWCFVFVGVVMRCGVCGGVVVSGSKKFVLNNDIPFSFTFSLFLLVSN